MRTLVLLVLMAVLPRESSAAVCVNLSPPNSQLVLEWTPGSGFFRMAGEFVNPPGDLCPSYPLSGSGHIRADGKLHFGLAVNQVSSVDLGCRPLWLAGTLDPPSFNSGSAIARGLTDPIPLNLVIAPTTCPPLPQRSSPRE